MKQTLQLVMAMIVCSSLYIVTSSSTSATPSLQAETAAAHASGAAPGATIEYVEGFQTRFLCSPVAFGNPRLEQTCLPIIPRQ